jgi:hypothetical protein
MGRVLRVGGPVVDAAGTRAAVRPVGPVRAGGGNAAAVDLMTWRVEPRVGGGTTWGRGSGALQGALAVPWRLSRITQERRRTAGSIPVLAACWPAWPAVPVSLLACADGVGR